MVLLQKAGVPAGAVLDAAELLDNKHLKERNFFLEINHPEVGPRKYCSLPIKFSNALTSSRRPAPCLGEHNEYVLHNLLGYTEDEIDELRKKNIIGIHPID
jgi:crotonobetainyl-CoA:carnitine CoA-transferase CaiB-like acyl-CoA transferase